MLSNERISQILKITQGFQDLDVPVILASGLLGVYYVNTEKLVQDNGIWQNPEFENDASLMVQHAISMMREHPTFEEVIDIMAEHIAKRIHAAKKETGSDVQYVISGGQRRDWLFSGPVSNKLHLPHVALYKQENGIADKIDNISRLNVPYRNVTSFHVADLLTTGSSEFRMENGIAKGWVPMLRHAGINVETAYFVVSRLQGGEENLLSQKVLPVAFTYIDEEFLRANATHVERDIEYFAEPKLWSETYLQENGATPFLAYFNPEGKKLDKAKAFVGQFETHLKKIGRYTELENAVQDTYKKSIQEILKKAA